jgi:hypothetical protein
MTFSGMKLEHLFSPIILWLEQYQEMEQTAAERFMIL